MRDARALTEGHYCHDYVPCERIGKTLMREGCVILDQGARGTEPYAERENPVYKADERDKFLSAKGNGLYMAIRKG